MEILDNKTKIVKDDLVKNIKKGDKMSIAASCFSIYAFEELKSQLKNLDQLRFIFTSPTFISERDKRKEFYISKLEREKSLYGTEFELRLRNELKQKAISKECSKWIKEKAVFKSLSQNNGMNSFIQLTSDNNSYTYQPINGFTSVDLGIEKGKALSNVVTRFENPLSNEMLEIFDSIWENEQLEDVTEKVIDMIENLYQENSPELIYFMTLYNIFNEFLENISEDDLANESTGFKNSKIWNKLYDFQKDAVLAIINKLEKYNGCILADSVGLGKTFTALSVIKYYECRNKNVLVLCPKKLSDNWMTYRGNLRNNPISEDRFRYDVLYHTDLSREKGISAIGLPIEQINWENYDLVVIDESHNFRNGIGTHSKRGEKENRYLRLMNRIIKPGVKTKVLMLSATPVNNRFSDLRNQLALAYEGDSASFDEKLNTRSDIETIFREAQKAYNVWIKQPEEERTTSNLLSRLSFDFFEILDSVTIARSRKHIEKYYDSSKIGVFPKREKPISIRPKLTELPNTGNYQDIYKLLEKLNLTIYTPVIHILSSKVNKYLNENESIDFRKGREAGIKRLMSINLLKRLESSIYAFSITINKVKSSLIEMSNFINEFKNKPKQKINQIDNLNLLTNDFDDDDKNTEYFTVGKKIPIKLEDMDYITWKREIDNDIEILDQINNLIKDITPEYDNKLNKLYELIIKKVRNQINSGNKKVLIFTAFADTANYLYENLALKIKSELGLNTALITGSANNQTSISNFNVKDINRILTSFSPCSKEKEILYPYDLEDIDILIATDCISEGQNLQDCDYCVNYDIHWNPVRIIQRFGRIDRIGSKNKSIQLVNFWPDLDLDEYINLKDRVENRMKISILTSTGDDDPLNLDEKGDLDYRRTQLKRLQNEIVDLENMSGGISIMDLGLNEFRLDLLSYIKNNNKIEKIPYGIHAVVKGDIPGIIFILKNINEEINIKNQNRFHPFYLVYMDMEGNVITNHLQVKETLNILRSLSKGQIKPIKKLTDRFNRKTKDGSDMRKISKLLEDSINSIISKKEESDILSFFTSGETTFLSKGFSGLDDFELICFLVVL